MPSWRRHRRRLLGWLSNSRKNSGSGWRLRRLSLIAPVVRERRLDALFALVGSVFWENRVCWVVFNDVGGFD